MSMKIDTNSEFQKLQNTQRFRVVRPQCRLLAKKVALAIFEALRRGELSEAEGKIAFENMLSLQPYKFVGFLHGDKSISDGRLPPMIIDRLLEGDSFIADAIEGGQPEFHEKPTEN